MPICIPAHPEFSNNSERDVWNAIRDSLRPSDVLLSNLRFTNRAGDHEADLVVALENGAIVVIEVKGGSVSHDGRQWWQHGRITKSIQPVAQAQRVKYVLRDYLDTDPRWGRRRTRFLHMVAFPYSRIAPDFAMPDCPRWIVLDKDDLAGNPVRLIQDAIERHEGSNPVLDADGIADLVACLDGRGLPQRDLLAVVADREAMVDRFTAQQAIILSALRVLNRVEIVGGAGSGKTWLAVEHARRLSAEGKRVALTCYSRGLAAFLQRRVVQLREREQPAYVGTYHGLGERWGAPSGENDDSLFWEQTLPGAMVELARELPAGERFDAIVVDEAQDFADSWWPALIAALNSEEDGGLFVYADEGQRVFARGGRVPVPLVPIVLDQNLRNTIPIARVFGSLTPIQMRYRGGEGPPVRVMPCSSDDAVGCADDAVEALLEEGWAPEHIALLTTGRRHPEQVARQQMGQDHYWSTYYDTEQVFYGHVLGFKGLERPAVVLAVNGFGADERAREKLYVGLSRARDLLVVCGDLDVIGEAGGPAVVRRLHDGLARGADSPAERSWS